MIESFLRSMGLSNNEIQIYIHLLSFGESIASTIAKRIGIRRTSVYATLESLEQKRIIISYKKNDITHFGAVDPDEIVRICEQRVVEMNRLANKANSIRGELKKIQAKSKSFGLGVRSTIKHYQGIESVTDLIDETLDIESNEQLCIGLNSYHTNSSDKAWVDYTNKRVKCGIFVRSIQPDTVNAHEYKKRDVNELRETKLVSSNNFPDGFEMNIIGDTVAMFTAHGVQPTGMKIKNKYIAQMIRTLFELAWKNEGK